MSLYRRPVKQENRKARFTMSQRHGVLMRTFSSSTVRNSRLEALIFGFSLASSTRNGLLGMRPSTTALSIAAAIRYISSLAVVSLIVSFPLWDLHVLRKATKPRQNSLSTSERRRSGFPMEARYSSTRTFAFRLLTTPDGDNCASQVTKSSSQETSVVLNFFSFSQSTRPSFWMSRIRWALICSASLRVFLFCNFAAGVVSGIM